MHGSISVKISLNTPWKTQLLLPTVIINPKQKLGAKGITHTQTQLVSGLLSLRRKATKSSVCAETTRMQMTIDSPHPHSVGESLNARTAEIDGCALLIVMLVCMIFLNSKGK